MNDRGIKGQCGECGNNLFKKKTISNKTRYFNGDAEFEEFNFAIKEYEKTDTVCAGLKIKCPVCGNIQEYSSSITI